MHFVVSVFFVSVALNVAVAEFLPCMATVGGCRGYSSKTCVSLHFFEYLNIGTF